MYDSQTVGTIQRHLLFSGETLAVAESVTAGHIQAALSLADDASRFFQGGITAYNLAQKIRLLKIDAEHGHMCNCVSQKVACDMAAYLCHMFHCDWSIAVTGYADTGQKNDRDYPYAIFAIAHHGRPVSVQMLKAKQDDFFHNQLGYSNRILKSFLRTVEENEMQSNLLAAKAA